MDAYVLLARVNRVRSYPRTFQHEQSDSHSGSESETTLLSSTCADFVEQGTLARGASVSASQVTGSSTAELFEESSPQMMRRTKTPKHLKVYEFSIGATEYSLSNRKHDL